MNQYAIKIAGLRSRVPLMSAGTSVSSLSSSVAVKLMRTLEAVQESTRSFTATKGSPAFDAVAKASISSRTLFSVLAAAQTSQVPVAIRQPDAQTAVAGGQEALADDPHFEKDYTVDQAGANWYAGLQNLAKSLANTPGATQPGATAGQIVATSMAMTGDKAASFAIAFDTGTLKYAAMITVPGVAATCTRTFIKDGSGTTIGGKTEMNCNEPAWQAYSTANPNTIWADDCGAKGSGGLLITW